MLKVKLLAALAAIASFECVGPYMPTRPEETGTTRQGLTLPPLPALPSMQEKRVLERGTSTGLPTSGARSAYLFLMKDPYDTTKVLAYGFDPLAEKNLFVLTFALADAGAFQHTWVNDIGQWKASGSSSVKSDSATDGLGGTPIPTPRPGLTDLIGWKQTFYAHQMQSQIDAENAGYLKR